MNNLRIIKRVTYAKLIVASLFYSMVLHGAGGLDYQTGLKQLQDQHAQQQNPFSEQDMAILQKAALQLKQQLPVPGLATGVLAPDFTLTDAFGQPQRLADELNKGPVVLVFYRGAWCPFCNLHLHVLNKHLSEFKKYGAQLIAVTPQKPDKSAEQIKKDAYPFMVLSDLDSRVMKDYQLYYELSDELVTVYKKHGLDIESFNGKGRNVLPVPGTYIIGRNGVIKAKHADTDYQQRMEPVQIIQVLKTL